MSSSDASTAMTPPSSSDYDADVERGEDESPMTRHNVCEFQQPRYSDDVLDFNEPNESTPLRTAAPWECNLQDHTADLEAQNNLHRRHLRPTEDKAFEKATKVIGSAVFVAFFDLLYCAAYTLFDSDTMKFAWLLLTLPFLVALGIFSVSSKRHIKL
ncbi:hypothetical protein BDV96DRAFT_655453 [Lophiotrema nucula]|uniref:Uncharacterized protein n=1 Tax=Lophiotrema nucula TaxID=690887 RepID=A0A6A5YFV3_9PLEO|nr:hypothetical protein BDV96DRAFT_655453 [Lophiotrema nucula]